MQINNPYLLFILLGLLPYFIYFRKINARLPFALILVAVNILLVFAISEVQIKLTDKSRELFVVIDNSPSMNQSIEKSSDNIVKLIKDEFEGLNSSDSINLITSSEGQFFAKNILLSDLENSFKQFNFSTVNESNLTLPIMTAISSIKNPESSGLLIITDGGVTENLDKFSNALLKLRNNKINTKLRILNTDKPKNTIILSMKSPQQVRVDEPVIFSADIHSNFDDTCNFEAEFFLDNAKKQVAKTQLYFGETPLKPDNQGLYQLSKNNIYHLYIWGSAPNDVSQIQCKLNVKSNDEIKFDNSVSESCFVTSGKSVLIFTRNGSKDFLSEFLTKNFPDTKVVLQNPAEASVNVENYLVHKLIIFSDADSESFGDKRNEIFSAIHDAVTKGGVNFAMCGGRKSFAPGGYYKTKLEDLLPVSLDPNKDKKRAVVLMLDRSESMNTLIDSVTKISRVCSASVDFLDNLKTDDLCAFISFSEDTDDSGETVDLKKLNQQNASKIADRLKILGSSRTLIGRTNIESALKNGINKLKNRSEEVKLLILFSDGEPTVGATKPEDFTDLINDAKKNNIHISFVIAGARSSLFDKITSELGEMGNVEYLSENWDIDEAFRKALLKAGGKLIYQGNTAVLNPDKEIFVSNELFGYVRTSLKKFNSAESLLISEKHDPLVATWKLGSSRVSAVMLPFNDFDLFWETSVPVKISGFLKNHLKLLMESNESDFEIQTEYSENHVLLTVRDNFSDQIRDISLVFGDEQIALKPVLPGVYNVKFNIEFSESGKIVEDNKTLMPVVFSLPNSREFFEIAKKAQLIDQMFTKYFGEYSANTKLHNMVIPKNSKMYSLNKIILSLAILLIISWSILMAFKSRK